MSETYPLTIPPDLLRDVRQTAKKTGLSMADAMRQSIKLGLPKLKEQLAVGRITNVAPLPDKQARRLYSEPDADDEAIHQFMAAQSTAIEK